MVSLQAICPVFASELQTRAIPALVRAGLQFDVFGLESVSTPEKPPVGKVLAASPVVVVLNEIERFLFEGQNSESVLADPECGFTNPLRINYDLIEVSDGWFFSASKREFVQNAIRDAGKESPRAFVEYDHTMSPDAKYFKEILENNWCCWSGGRKPWRCNGLPVRLYKAWRLFWGRIDNLHSFK